MLRGCLGGGGRGGGLGWAVFVTAGGAGFIIFKPSMSSPDPSLSDTDGGLFKLRTTPPLKRSSLLSLFPPSDPTSPNKSPKFLK